MGSQKQYEVVISCAGQDGDLAENLAKALEDRSITTFYHRENITRAELLGKSLPSELEEIYENRGQHCIVILSDAYLKSTWTEIEFAAASRRASRQSEYLLALRLGDAHVPYLLREISFLDWANETVESIADLVLLKLGKVRWEKIDTANSDRSITWEHSWRDISWIGSQGWLVGAI